MKHFLFCAKSMERRHIMGVLEQAKHVPVVMIAAPMGHGKTTIVEKFLAKKQDSKKMWVALGQSEIHEEWLWTKICDRLQEAGFAFSSAMQENGLPENQYERECMIDVLRDGFAQTTYLVIDDCHECKSARFLDLLECLAYEKIPNLQIIVISRNCLNLRYEELWMKGSCILIDQEILTMAESEIKEFFQINGVELPQTDLEQINAYTQGWMAAVYLVFIDYKSSGRFRNLGGVSNLVYQFIFNGISEAGKQILMKLSLFDSYTLEQAVYVTQMEECRYLLPDLAESIIFIKYNPDSAYYSLHAVLRSVVGQEREKEKLDKEDLYQRNARWYEENEKYVDALQNYIRANRRDAVYRILRKHHDSGIYDQAGGMIRSFFENGDKEEQRCHPIAYLSYIYKLVVQDHYFEGKRLFEEAWDYYSTHGSAELPMEQIQAELYLMKCTLEFNDLEKMAKDVVTACEMMKDKHSRIFSDAILTYGAPEMLFLYHSKPGRLKRTVEMAKRYTFYYSVLVNGYESGWDGLFDAEYDFTTGNIIAAEQLAEWIYEKAVICGNTCIVISACFLRLRCLIHSGNFKKFFLLMEELNQHMQQNEMTAIRMEYEITISYLYGCIAQTEKIASWIMDFKLENCNRMVRSVRSGCVVYGITLIIKREWIRLEVLAEEMLVPYSTSKHVYVSIYAEIYYALAQYHLHGMENGLIHLERCLNLARQDSIKMPIVEYVSHLEPMLSELAATDSYAVKLLAMGQKQKEGIAAFGVGENVKKRNLLTEREREIMEYVTKGRTNQEISQAMHIALVTVEKNLTRIYRKLDVQNRAAAIGKVKEMQ